MSKEKIIELVHNGGDIEAYLNAVRAEGVEMFGDFWQRNCGHSDTFIGREANKYAAQLRAGNAGKDGSHE